MKTNANCDICHVSWAARPQPNTTTTTLRLATCQIWRLMTSASDGTCFWASDFTHDCISTYPQETREQVKWKAFISMVLSHTEATATALSFVPLSEREERIVFTLCLHRGAMFDVIVGIISNSILLRRSISHFLWQRAVRGFRTLYKALHFCCGRVTIYHADIRRRIWHSANGF